MNYLASVSGCRGLNTNNERSETFLFWREIFVVYGFQRYLLLILN